MRKHVFLSSILIALASAIPTTKTQTSELVTDGSFESVPAKAYGVANIKSGHWNITGFAVFTSDEVETGNYKTPYGKKYVLFKGTQTSYSAFAYVEQKISGLPVDGTITLSYSVRHWPSPDRCGIGAQIIWDEGNASQDFNPPPPPTSESPPGWQHISGQTLSPAVAYATLQFRFACGKQPVPRVFLYGLDDISLVGQASE